MNHCTLRSCTQDRPRQKPDRADRFFDTVSLGVGVVGLAWLLYIVVTL